MNEFYDELIKKIDKSNILLNESMKKHTSFKTGGLADYFITVKDVDTLIYLLNTAKKYNIDTYIIGNGTNLLVRDNGYRGAIIKLDFNKLEINNDTVTAGCGVPLAVVANETARNSYSGFEALNGIPGTIGGAVKMNAGAYGTEIKDLLIESKVLNENNQIITLKNSEHGFRYRGSNFFENNLIILESTFKLVKGKKEEIERKMEEIRQKRISTQPLDKPNAGSTFKKIDDNTSTAKLIDEASLKGKSIGGAMISNKHAGFIVNDNNATSEDIIKLIKYTKDIIKTRYGKEIEEEIIIIGK